MQRQCAIDHKEGCFDNNAYFEAMVEKGKELLVNSFKELGDAINQGPGASGLDIRKMPAILEGETCVCKEDLCNASQVLRTSSVVTIAFVVLLINYL